MIYFFGDIHFSSMSPWSHDIGEYFIRWFKERFKNENCTNTLIFLGDITEKDSNPGDVIDQMYRLFYFCNMHFKKVIVLMGNHDLKIFRGHTLQSSLKFLNNFSNITVIDDVTEIECEGKHILCMPHIRTDDNNLGRYYNNYDWSSKSLSNNISLAIGHWIIQDKSNIIYRDGIDITRIPVNRPISPVESGVLCGHVHNRPAKDYIGSIWPANTEELKCKYPRAFVKWEDTWEEELLPDFVKYDTITYGDEIEHKYDCVHLYMVDDAPSEGDAKRKYSGFYLKSVKQKKNKNVVSATTESSDSVNSLHLTHSQLFEEMLKEKKLVLSRDALKIIRELLKQKDAQEKTN